ncbi:UDP-3-O-(3-hydroxymyristoyl)glucosamine N-acyltransferase [bacterium endosymbiont of Pedicinus badii]|uniref:UDP-3-O-(3-hydroxymyristoyl)glucosamine N-acyltransferase n=1 Tax=bacterium endosymbiont of Pedicinus badii TaxID=1719126 RepID=UPI0009BB8495|nr:UDP-3-O-(3-hydroxymyristoyl)glucosamine N-acyltransferase [bacterium endosymbiont of Pedicinus badii]OQM33991.1 UDP-3-O-(3-hydroxymyristoyl) glucosamine N-acyltransferase [bacterium endosymbiont of Pedicinus badii]
MFFPIELYKIANYLKAEIHGKKKIKIYRFNSIESAKNGEISFLSNKKYRKKLLSCHASAVLLKKEDLPFCKTSAIIVKNPYLSYIKIMNALKKKKKKYSISKFSEISPNAIVSKNVSIGSYTCIEEKVLIEKNVSIGTNCFIGKNTKIGKGTQILSNVVIHENVTIGEKCYLKSNTVIGSEGFGFIKENQKWIKIPQIGKTYIGNNTEIGSNTTIDRGSIECTFVENGVIIDNHCHIAHNVYIGSFTAIAGGVIIGGGAKIGKFCMIGGASVINGHIEICDKVSITGMGMVMRSIKKSGVYSSGIPVQTNQRWRRNTILSMNLEKLIKNSKKF